MPNLIILIPFNADATCDLDQSAAEMQTFFNNIANHQLGNNIGALINNIVILHQGTPYVCAPGDYVILFAHGGKNDTGLSNNSGQAVSRNNAMAQLVAIGAQNTTRVLFMCCFSALANHIAASWRAAYPAQSVYGGNAAISNLYSVTRTQIRAVCAALYAL